MLIIRSQAQTLSAYARGEAQIGTMPSFMSKQLISQYYNKVDKLVQYGGSNKETSIRNEFYNLLNSYAENKNLVLVAELPVRGTKGRDVTPDGTLKNVLRLDYGYWESKDEALDLDEEIDKKIRKGYPLTNTLFEDSRNAVLFQSGQEVMRVDMHKPDELHQILTAFINFEKPEVRKFNDAVARFQVDIPTILETFRNKIDAARKINKNFISVSESFLELCKEEINPDITLADVREMMIQHILTSDIFSIVFDDPEFHNHNNIASELEKLIGTLFSYAERKNLLGSIQHYYDAINATAASIADHHEKQNFLKALYERFYKAYNPKAADRLGVVYTPNEIVDFIIESTNHLLERHFGRVLWDKDVEILDPATGTGTFICNMIDKCPKQDLLYKYKKEFHANEVAILPYYISNLNIEYTFKQKMASYEEFRNICFVDTLDNIDGLRVKLPTGHGLQKSLFQFTAENSRRIMQQNERKISVIVGNPPYNANQKNENENNKNRTYPAIDKRIKDTYIKNSTAQKTKVYDMYARFYRWAMDRIERNGVIAFISNRSFIDSRTFDGFRKCIQDEFSHCYIIDTKSDVRLNPKIAGTTHNVFGIQTGVAVMFLVRTERNKEQCGIEYTSMPDEWRKEVKLEWFRNNRFQNITFERITPDKKHNWINIANTDFDSLVPLAIKGVKLGKKKEAVFELFSLGVVTARDEWVYDDNEKHLETKVKFLIDVYNKDAAKHKGKKKSEIKEVVDYSIKWTRAVINDLANGKKYQFDKELIIESLYRPFAKRKLYFSRELNEMQYQLPHMFMGENRLICVNHTSSKLFNVIATDRLPDYHINGDAICISLYRYDDESGRKENVTDWGRDQFVNHYKDKRIKKEDIFHYTYAVLHNPAYRKKYELNLRREFPRVPLYQDFWKWANWGGVLMDLHINYERVEPFPLKENAQKVKAEGKPQKEMFSKAAEPEAMYGYQPKVKCKLKAHKEAGIIELDELTSLTGVPKEAWEYKLGNRSALEWVLDQYKEKKPSDPTIAEKFNTYRFADYKGKVIDLLKRICTVSVETVRILDEMSQGN
jgi:predicted helicase